MIELIITALIFLMCFLTYAMFRISRRLSYFVSNLEETFYSIESFREHLELVYGLDKFHGDDTLQSLLEHGKELSDFLGESQSIFSLDEKEFLKYVEDKDNTAETSQTLEEQTTVLHESP